MSYYLTDKAVGNVCDLIRKGDRHLSSRRGDQRILMYQIKYWKRKIYTVQRLHFIGEQQKVETTKSSQAPQKKTDYWLTEWCNVSADFCVCVFTVWYWCALVDLLRRRSTAVNTFFFSSPGGLIVPIECKLRREKCDFWCALFLCTVSEFAHRVQSLHFLVCFFVFCDFFVFPSLPQSFLKTNEFKASLIHMNEWM